MRNYLAAAVAVASQVTDEVLQLFHLLIFSAFHQPRLGCDRVGEYGSG